MEKIKKSFRFPEKVIKKIEERDKNLYESETDFVIAKLLSEDDMISKKLDEILKLLKDSADKNLDGGIEKIDSEDEVL